MAAERETYGWRRPLAALFGVRLVSDLHQRLCDLGLRPPIDAKRRQRLDRIRATGALFIHVPKNAGMSVSQALYGQQIKHATIRYYQTAAPDIVRSTPSFAILRNPADRFISAFRYAQAGGTYANRVSLPFRARYQALTSLDEAIEHVEGAASPYQVDHIFRPQAWYLTGRNGAVAVDRLVPIEAMHRLGEVIPALRDLGIPRLNSGAPPALSLSRGQRARIERLYPQDFTLYEAHRDPGPRKRWPEPEDFDYLGGPLSEPPACPSAPSPSPPPWSPPLP